MHASASPHSLSHPLAASAGPCMPVAMTGPYSSYSIQKVVQKDVWMVILLISLINLLALYYIVYRGTGT